MLKKIAVAAVVYAMLPLTATLGMAQENSQQKIMDAVMQVYADELRNNPNDYVALYSRANQYYINGDYDSALKDVNAALRVTTRDDMETLVDEYVLRAKIYNATNKPQLALADLREANKLNPSSDTVLTMLAAAYYDTGDYGNARACYLSLYRRNNINYVAILGLARSEVHLNNLGQAEEYANQAVELYPAQADVFIGRADVMQMLGKNRQAANDLIVAMSISNDATGALQALIKLSDCAYDDVVAALSAAIESVPSTGMFYYILASVQVGHSHYADGLLTLEKVMARGLYDYHGIYYDAAQAAYNLCRYDEALDYINKAIGMQGDIVYYYVMKSQILSAMNDVAAAYNAVKTGLSINAGDAGALYQKAILDIDAGEYRTALLSLNEIIMTSPSWSIGRYMRGWVQLNCMNDAEASKSDFNEVLLSGDGSMPIKGFALHQLGRDAEAAEWCKSITAGNMKAGGEAYYTAAVLMSQCGNAEAAIDYLGKALDAGYGSRYDIMVNEAPLKSLQSIRHLESFKALVASKQAVFE